MSEEGPRIDPAASNPTRNSRVGVRRCSCIAWGVPSTSIAKMQTDVGNCDDDDDEQLANTTTIRRVVSHHHSPPHPQLPLPLAMHPTSAPAPCCLRSPASCCLRAARRHSATHTAPARAAAAGRRGSGCGDCRRWRSPSSTSTAARSRRHQPALGPQRTGTWRQSSWHSNQSGIGTTEGLVEATVK